ncbi:pirin-like C-terminal cupin domain-containing protein [Streptomyces afghaniensis]|uniref:pirin-like C-terminal cupin domain-containing protein n=1 Tax=Streptomyces afghaniensis TaxID=66865 RepID=UPI00277FD852|nr:pirin-like C-terminal cupin domain-containing protein [Streptomyces afghaniensis]MDQ1014380.1 hypothetical protein [Streptomyces afghaniensis]
MAVHGRPLLPGKLGYLGEGRDELHLEVREPARAILLGGELFPEPIFMWWNFVARTRDEIDAAHASWTAQDHRFGRVRSTLPLIQAKAPVLAADRREPITKPQTDTWPRATSNTRQLA